MRFAALAPNTRKQRGYVAKYFIPLELELKYSWCHVPESGYVGFSLRKSLPNEAVRITVTVLLL